ncbi:MAG: ArdC family protein [Vicinamibacterales bacterium]
MNADELKKLTTSALDQLRAALDEGHSERLTELLKTMGRFHRYSVNNICLIMSQRPTATRVAGFHTWRTMGRFVRKGEKGIAILAPIVGRKRDDTCEESRTVVGFRTAYVFDVGQTDGAPLPEASQATGDPGANTDRLLGAIASSGIAVEHADDLDGALGLSRGGRIQILKGLDRAAEFSVLVHEYAHELLHRSADRPASRDTRELEAEAVAFVVSTAIGLEVTDAARDYIHLYQGDGEALSQSLDRIQHTASAILAAIGSELRLAA